MSGLWSVGPPALPHPWVMQVWLHLGWSLVLAWVGASLMGRWRPAPAGKLDGWQWGVALGLALWSWIPGPYSPPYWLGLAFQAPSIVTVLLCDAMLRARFFSTRLGMPSHGAPSKVALGLALGGVLAGWALLLDSFAQLPMQLYAWGFSTAAVLAVLGIALLPWVVVASPAPAGALQPRLWMVPVAVILFAVLRLPSGNVWDAVLDPWLWLVLHGYVARALWRGLRR